MRDYQSLITKLRFRSALVRDLSSICFLKSLRTLRLAHGSREKDDGTGKKRREERGKRTWESCNREMRQIRRAVNQLSLHLPPNVAILRFVPIRSFYSRLRPSRTFPPPPRVLRRLFHRWIHGMSTRFVLGHARADVARLPKR